MNHFEYPSGATPLDPEEIDGLKLKHISTRDELDRWEQNNIQDALAWLERRKKTDLLNEGFICQLHEKMFGKVWKWAGEFRRTNKNIGINGLTYQFNCGNYLMMRVYGLNILHILRMKLPIACITSLSGYIFSQMEMVGMLALWPM